jgi:hypothetical protein
LKTLPKILHYQYLEQRTQINAKIKKIKPFWFFELERKSTGFVQLIDVPRLALIKGDTIVTEDIGNFSRKISILEQ